MEISLDETTKRSIAVEGAICTLTMALFEQKSISTLKTLEVLKMLSSSSENTAGKLRDAISKLEQLVSLGEK